MTERFKNAYDRLVKAYITNGLMANDCTACAVGNMCDDKGWFRAVLDFREKVEVIRTINNNTGYSIEELSQIEYTFEENTHYKKEGYYSTPARIVWTRDDSPLDFIKETPEFMSKLADDQFNGLKAVIELLMSFDKMSGEPDMTPFDKNQKLKAYEKAQQT